jgi:hypothetical protein
MSSFSGLLVILVILIVYYIYKKYIDTRSMQDPLVSANGKSVMPINTFLAMGEYVTNGSIFMIQQADGNLCIYNAPSPADNQNKVPLWCNGAAERASKDDTQFITEFNNFKLSTLVQLPDGKRKLLWYMTFPESTTEIKLTERGPI